MNEHELVHRIRRQSVKSMSDPSHPIGVVAAPWGAHQRNRIKQADPANGRPLEIVSYANTAAVDLEDEVVLPEGGDVASYLKKNQNLFADHCYGMIYVVAKCFNMTLDQRGWLCTGQFFKNYDTEYTRACIAMAMAGTLAMSIGFEALDYGDPTPAEERMYPGVKSIVRRWKALEVSYTAMPMNVTCRQVATNIAAAEAYAEKARKSLIDAHVSLDVIKRFGIKSRRTLILT